MIMDMKNPHAVALGKLGGEARANKTSPEKRKEWARLGGLARVAKHTKKELSRWGKMGGRPKGSGKHRQKGPQ